MRHVNVIKNVILSIFVFATFSFQANAAPEVARINNKVITLDEFNSKYKESLKFFRYKAPTKQNVLDDMVKRELGIQEAKKIGLDKDPEVIERINTVLYHSLLDKKLAKKFDSIDVTDAEVSSYYKKNPEVRTSHIFVQVRFDSTPAQEKTAHAKIKKIEGILNEALKSGKKTFAEVAREHSEGVAAAAGGDIDFQTKDKLDPVYYETAVKLGKEGATSGVVRTQFGYHIIKLTGVKSFDEVDKGLYKRIIFDEKRAQIFDSYMGELRQKSKVTVNNNALKN